MELVAIQVSEDRGSGAGVEVILARLAGRSHGVVARAELLEAGISSDEIGHRIRRGSLIRVHRGVYRVGHAAPSVLARYAAAVKAAGDRALLAGRAAAHLHRLLRGAAPRPELIVSSDRRIAGVVTHRWQTAPQDAVAERGIPVTTVARTIVDLARVLSPPGLARAVHEASTKHRLGPDAIEAILARRHNWPGCRALRSVLWGETPVTLSRLESKFLERLGEAGLPLPRSNEAIGDRIVDCHWPEQRLTVELDGYRYHRTRHAWEQDRRREREARARGDDFRRFSYADVFEDPRPMLRELRARLLPGDFAG